MDNMLDLNEKLLETPDICALYNVSRRTVYRWIKDGKLKGKRVGRKWLFSRSSVLDLLK